MLLEQFLKFLRFVLKGKHGFMCDCLGSGKKQENGIFPLGEISSNPDPDPVHKKDLKGATCNPHSVLSATQI